MDALEKKEKITGRVLYLDYLRILATVFVILIHVSAQNWGSVETGSYAWTVFSWTNNAARWAVPVFVMLSGALLLDPGKRVTVKGLYQKNIFRMVTALFFWSALYALLSIWQGVDRGTVKTALLHGHYHMWYIHLAVGLYVITPVARKITETKETAGYFLLIAIFFIILLPEGCDTLLRMDVPHTAAVLSAISTIRIAMNFSFPSAFLLYYIMGSYLYQHELPGWLRKGIYLLGIWAYLSAVLDLEGMTGGKITAYFPFGVYFVNTCMSAAVFLFGKHVLSQIRLSQKWEKAVGRLSADTFGIYLVHVLVLEILKDVFGLHTLTFGPAVSVLVITALVMVISAGISFALHQIPLLKKYVV